MDPKMEPAAEIRLQLFFSRFSVFRKKKKRDDFLKPCQFRLVLHYYD